MIVWISVLLSQWPMTQARIVERQEIRVLSTVTQLWFIYTFSPLSTLRGWPYQILHEQILSSVIRQHLGHVPAILTYRGPQKPLPNNLNHIYKHVIFHLQLSLPTIPTSESFWEWVHDSSQAEKKLLTQGVSTFFYKGPDSKYYKSPRLLCSVLASKLCCWSVKAATDDAQASAPAVLRQAGLYRNGQEARFDPWATVCWPLL